MAATNLRDYLAGIEQLIDSNQVEDALAHCRHVLKSHPKNIATYRLMGKAYLESKRHSEASDLFQRVLSSVPDDFVAHIGMSIIREDEGNLDAAIWHMERAFESQPSNKAVQGEVRRLYGAREGYEPPKVRLTRGALARMYSHGDLYNQAISELRNALAEDAQRPDLQILLAEMYFKNNQHTEAIEVCHQIIQKLPYCLYANRVMADMLRNRQRDVEATPYWERVQELDPYAAQVSTLKDVEQVPADSVMIEALVLDGPIMLGPPQAAEAHANEMAHEKEDLPDWLSVEDIEAAPEVQEANHDSVLSSLEGLEPGPEPIGQPGGPSAFAQELEELAAAEAEDAAAINEPFKTGALEPDEIPDWLRELRPGASAPPLAATPEPEAPGKRWTEEFAQAGFAPTGPLNLDDLPDEPAQAEPAGEQEPEPAPALEPTSRPTGWLATGELRWMDDAFADEEQPAEPAEAEPTRPATPPQMPEWLANLNEDELGNTQPTRPSASAFTEAPAFASPAFEAEEDPLANTTDDNPAWLNDLQANAGMSDEPDASETGELEPDEDASQRLDALADWQTPAADEALQAEATPSAPAQPAHPDAEPNPEEQETLNWLEGLAARRGAAEDELLTSPEERTTSQPDWLQDESTPAETSQPGTDAALPPGRSENLNWLDELAAAADPVPAGQDVAETPPGDTHQPAEYDITQPEPLVAAEDSPFSQEDVLAEDEAGTGDGEAAGQTEAHTPSWLRPLTQSLDNAMLDDQPVAPRPLEEAPDWLSELSAEAPAAATPDEPDTEPEAWPQEEDEASPAPAIEPRWVPASELPGPANLDTPAVSHDEAVHAPAAHALEPAADWLSELRQPEPEAWEAEVVPAEQAEVGEADVTAEEAEAGEADSAATQQPEDAPDFAAPRQPEPQASAPAPAYHPPAEPAAAAQAEALPATPQPVPAAPSIASPAAGSPAAAPVSAPARKRARGLSPEEVEDRLAEARQALNYGNLSEAAEAYSYFLRRRVRLEEVIADLRAASRRFPRQVAVWQTLGDAYMRNDQLTEALDCYTRAKALL